MAHDQQLRFIKIISSNLGGFFRDAKVLEVGSLNINGTIRGMFRNCDYIGLDVAKGKDVDIVCEGQKYDAPDNTFDHVISCEAMEHNPFWEETFLNMVRVCKPGGLITMSCASIGREEHGTRRTSTKNSPLTAELGWDYYRNLNERHFKEKFDFDELFIAHKFWENWQMYDLYFCGIKKADVIPGETIREFEKSVTEVNDYVNTLHGVRVCSYRSMMARLFGDKYFYSARKILNYLNYLHNWVE
jgi:SAM-dependent methyltransferase